MTATATAPAPAHVVFEDEAPRFLVEMADMPGEPSTVATFTATDLADYLRRNVEHDYYSGCGDMVRGIYRYDGLGKLTELTLVRAGNTVTRDDYLDWDYQVIEAAQPAPIVVVKFTVRIDGRA